MASLGNIGIMPWQKILDSQNRTDYMPFGPLKKITYANGTTRELDYDLDYRPTHIYTSNIQDLTYSFDSNNNITGITNGIFTNLTQTFGYDDENRLKSVSSLSGNDTYIYDKVGNRKNHNTSWTYETLTYEATSNQLVNSTSSYAAPVSRSYNSNGQLINEFDATFTYNDENRLSSYTKNGIITQ